MPIGDEKDGGRVYKSGSLLYVDADTFLTKGKEACTFNVLFEPTDTTAIQTYTFTKNFLILFIMDNVKIKTTFYKIGRDDNGGEMMLAGRDDEAEIQLSMHVRVTNSGGTRVRIRSPAPFPWATLRWSLLLPTPVAVLLLQTNRVTLSNSSNLYQKCMMHRVLQ